MRYSDVDCLKRPPREADTFHRWPRMRMLTTLVGFLHILFNFLTGIFMKKLTFSLLAVAVMAMGVSTAAYADAEASLKESKCGKCHAAAKEKTGPSWKKVAEKYKGNADAEAKLITHVTTGPKIKVDGEEEVHAKLKNLDPTAVKEVVTFILKN